MRKILILIACVSLLLGTACQSSKEGKKGGQNAAQEQARVGDGFQRLSNSQPIPSFDWSQERQTLIDIETIRATGATSTTAFYLEGVGLVSWCNSIGAPVPSTYQLSASQQWVDIPNDNSSERFNVDQGEPTGVYIGQSAGTWTLCLDDNGKKFGVAWEGYVQSVIGVVTSYPEDKRMKITSSTYQFKDPPK